ncbi:MAG TPA: response regulator [Thermoanaerobaculia bacterium]|nr:response regulator [Thermoanaerobaculia bacterium]
MRTKKILLVDDARTTLFLEEMLLVGKYRVVKATSGQEALSQAESERPDLILLDLVMPEMDGLETCRHLRALDATRNVPILFVTPRGQEVLLTEPTACAPSDVITKPINGEELLTKVQRLLPD